MNNIKDFKDDMLFGYPLTSELGFLESHSVRLDIARTLLGDKIGGGVARQVFNCRFNPRLVVKVEDGAGSFQNITESKWWDEVHDIKEVAKWFAPVLAISPCGTVLIQHKVAPARLEDYPEKVPEFLVDRKFTNFGIHKGRLVCFDYGLQLFSKGISKKLVKAEWWGAEW